MPRVRLTKQEKAALVQAATEILAGDPAEWKATDWFALQRGVDKLQAEARDDA